MYNVYAYYSRAMFVSSIDYCSRAFLFFPSFILSPSPLSSRSSFPFPLTFLPSSSFPLPFLSFFTLPFPTPPFLPNSPFPPISSSLIPPPFFPSIPPFLGSILPVQPLISFLFLHYSNPILFSTSSFFPTPPFLSIPLFHPIPSFHPSPPFLPTIPFIPIPPFHHTLLFLPIPPSLPPLLFFISLLYLFATFPSSASFLFSHFFPSSPSFPPLVPFLYIPLHSFLPYIHSFLPPLSLACLLPFSSLCYLLPLLLFLPLLHFHFPSHIPFLPFLPFLPHLSILLSFPPPSIALLHSLSPY